ncbi:hypothetical protein ACFO4U_02570 [Exiguobacterium profundum]|uniref:DUF2802 domain-containing protein n=1 Tax=Exiguobacterium profundum TaxID=307643 RepID=A0ABY8AWB3_9BACL|nr:MULTISPECIES: hypothetical protein [Exiguobacterium]QPI66609.1 hypothetical protein IR194_08960 [Exiguobacterium sp. PBE]MBQ6459668.1 hypothetical protein [Exiguobacterium sp.]MCT4798586.1 hypothetical protein [Exiguobacterium profundum]MDT0191308.1 hypothetical protein [Exiguobacterium sp. BG5(2022)]WED54177.1 hypothetical protein OE059_08925 [Exiguobacterium profundum]
MYIVYVITACLVAYGFLFGYRQVQALQERVERLEREKQETETLLLSFMESMNDLVVQEPVERSNVVQQEEASSLPVNESVQTVVEATEETTPSASIDVDDVLLRHSVRDAARILGKGEGELALYAKLRKK